jgi:CBS domain-containing protein
VKDIPGGLEALLVASAVQPVQYRVYPDTPLNEVVDLIVRRGVRAVPVVGDSFEVLGIITAGDALGHVLRDRPGGDVSSGEGSALAARDVMTRAVLCVSETQQLRDAAQMLVNRDVEQLPVVREGQLVGLLTREAILRALHPSPQDSDDDPEDDS